jgi:predicted RNA-binding protein with PUA-like domain
VRRARVRLGPQQLVIEGPDGRAAAEAFAAGDPYRSDGVFECAASRAWRPRLVLLSAERTGRMAHWLMKTEPSDYSWAQLAEDGVAVWDGVRNHQAARNMRAMRRGDRAFFYRSVENPGVVGVMEIVREAYEDPNDPKHSFALVDVRPVAPAQREVSLGQIKADPRLQHLALVRQSRLSVSPVDDAAWRVICELAGIEA